MNQIYSGSETWQSFLDIGKSHPPLTADEERQMTEAYFTSNHEKWKEIMILHSMRFAIAQSDRYTVRGEDRVDVCSRLIGGLTEAANRFDPSKGVRFLTFAGFYLKNSMRDAVDTKLAAVRTNNATMAIMDKRVDGKDKDTSATIGDFVGNFQSPDFDAIDPASEGRRAESEKSLQEIIDHFCTALDVLPDGERKNRIVSAFRITFGEGLSNAEVADRIGVSRWSVYSYLQEAVRIIRDSIDKGCVTMREWQSFVTDEKAGAAVKDIDASEEQFTEEEFAAVKEDYGAMSVSEDSPSSGVWIVRRVKEDGRRKIVKKDDGRRTGLGITESQFNSERGKEEIAFSVSGIGQAKSVYADDGFYCGQNDSVIEKSGLSSSSSDGSDIVPVNAGNTMFSRIALYKVDGRKHKMKGTWHSKPFFGNFYSEWNRMMQMRRSERIVTGSRVLQMINDGIIRKEECFRLSGGTIACRIR